MAWKNAVRLRFVDKKFRWVYVGRKRDETKCALQIFRQMEAGTEVDTKLPEEELQPPIALKIYLCTILMVSKWQLWITN